MHWGGLTLTSFFFTYFYYYPFPFLLFDSRFSKSKKFRLLVQIFCFHFVSTHFTSMSLFSFSLVFFFPFALHTHKQDPHCMHARQRSTAEPSTAQHQQTRASERDGRKKADGRRPEKFEAKRSGT